MDILKIDVEGYFIEVLKGIAAADLAKIRNIVIEVDYLPETGIKPDDVEGMLKAMGYETDCLDRSLSNGLTFYAWRSLSRSPLRCIVGWAKSHCDYASAWATARERFCPRG